jgi:spore maturation protein CgeB
MGGVAGDLVRNGARRVTLMPNGYCQVRFNTDLDPAQYDPEFDVVMIGNQWRNRNPTHFMFYARMQRYRQVAALFKRYGKRFGLFGQGWEGVPGALGPIAYDQQVAVMRRARVVVGAFPHSAMNYYTSDRAQIAMRSGIPYVEFYMPRMEKLHVDGEDWHLVRGIRGMLAQCNRLLHMDDSERLAMGANAAAHAVAGHSQYHRHRLMVAIIRQVRAAILAGTPAPLPQLDFFAPGVRLESEWPYAALGWG